MSVYAGLITCHPQLTRCDFTLDRTHTDRVTDTLVRQWQCSVCLRYVCELRGLEIIQNFSMQKKYCTHLFGYLHLFFYHTCRESDTWTGHKMLEFSDSWHCLTNSRYLQEEVTIEKGNNSVKTSFAYDSTNSPIGLHVVGIFDGFFLQISHQLLTVLL